MTVLRRALEKRGAIVGSWQSMDPAAIPPNSSAFRTAAGQVVDDQTALTLASVFRAVSIVSDSVAQMDWASYRGAKANRVLVDPQPKIIESPFHGLRLREGKAQVMVSLLMRGNAYLLVLARDKLGYPTLLLILHPDRVHVRPVKGKMLPEYYIGQERVDPADMLHIRGMTLPGQYMGISPIDVAAQSFAVGMAAREFASRYFAQGINPAGVIESVDPLDIEEARQIAQRIQQSHGGASNSHLPLVLDAGLSWKTITLTPEQAQFLATQQHSSGEVATWFGVPPHLLQDVSKTTSWGTGIEDQMMQYVTFTVRGWAQRMEESWDEMLPRGNYTRFDFESLLRANSLVRAQYYSLMRSIGVMNKDDIRAAEDEPPIPDGKGQDYDAPMNAPTPQPKVGLAPGEGGKDDSKG